MFVLDSILLFIIIISMYGIKIKYPNFLFFCHKAILFLPPNQEAIANKKEKKEDAEIRIIQIQYNHVKGYNKADDYDRVIFLLASLLIYVPLRWILSQICIHVLSLEGAATSSTFTFMVCLVLFVYLITIGLHIFSISSYNITYCILICSGLNLLYYFIALGLEGTTARDDLLADLCLDFHRQISIVFGKNITDSVLNERSILFMILVLNTVLSLVMVPSVIKMGNWYTKTLKEVYYENEETDQIADSQTRKLRQKNEEQLKEKSRKTIKIINCYFVAVLLFLFLSHRYSHQFLLPEVADGIRVLLMGFMVFANVYTLKDAIQFNSSFAYKYVCEYLGTNVKEVEKREKLMNRIMPYLHYIWYHKFQFMFRVFIPLLLFLVLIDLKYVHPFAVPKTPVISQTHCGVNPDELGILENLYKCQSGVSSVQIHEMSVPFQNGVMIGASLIDNFESTKQRIAVYGLLNGEFIVEVIEILMWYLGVSLYGMSIVYILFLRKTVYDI